MNSEEVKNLNNNIKKNLKNSKKIKEHNKKEKIINNDNNIKIKKNQCNKCFLEFNNYSSLEKHKLEKHPIDEYQFFHSQITDWSNYSLAYRDDPYY